MPRIGLRRLPLPWVAVALAVVVTTPSVAAPDASRITELSGYSALAEPVSTGTRSTFEPLPPTKLLDTRKSSAIPAGGSRTVQVTGLAGVPSDATAVVFNVTVVNPTVAGYVIVYPNGAPRPPVASITFAAKQTLANLAAVKIGSLGRVVVFNSTGAARHVLLDVTGYYRAHAHDDRYLTKADAQGRTATGAFQCPAGSYLQSVAADGAPTCVPDGGGTSFTPGSGVSLTDGVLSADQSRSAPNAMTCGAGFLLRAIAADGAPTCAADADTDTTYTAGFGLGLSNGVFSAQQGRSAPNAMTCGAGFLLRAIAADGAPTCAADADTDTTYTAGFGLGLSNGVFSAQQGRSAPNAMTCGAGFLLRAIAADGAPTCAADADTTYAAGFGLGLSNGVFSAEQGRSAKDAMYCEEGFLLRAIADDGAPTCAADIDTDTDTNTTYTAGFGLGLSNGVFSAEQGRSAPSAMTCNAGFLLRAIAANGAPTCAADANTTYTAGFGLTLTGTTFSAQQGRSAAGAFTCPAGQALSAVASDGAPTCMVVPSYTAGPGLTLSGGVIGSAYGSTVIPVRADGTPTENGTLLRNTMAAVIGATAEKPYVLALAPGTYELGATSLTMKPYVSVVGAGRMFTTITGARVSQSGGLVNLADQTTLAGVTVRNMVPAGTSFVTAIMSNGANVARLFDVHGYASQEGGETYGLLAFAGGLVTVENSQFTVINPTAIGTGIYAISNTTVRARNVEVGHAALGGWALHSYNASRIEFADGYANGAVRKGTPDSALHVSHSKIDGIANGGVQCFGVYNSAMTAATCT